MIVLKQRGWSHCICSHQTERDEGWVLSLHSFFFFNLIWDSPAHGLVLLACRVSFPTSVNSIEKFPHRYAQKFVSQMIVGNQPQPSLGIWLLLVRYVFSRMLGVGCLGQESFFTTMLRETLTFQLLLWPFTTKGVNWNLGLVIASSELS